LSHIYKVAVRICLHEVTQAEQIVEDDNCFAFDVVRWR